MKPWLVYACPGRYITRFARLADAIAEADSLSGLGLGIVVDRYTGDTVYVGQRS